MDFDLLSDVKRDWLKSQISISFSLANTLSLGGYYSHGTPHYGHGLSDLMFIILQRQRPSISWPSNLA